MNADNPVTANIHAKLGADLVSALAYGVDISKGEKVLPTSLGLNVNIPKINGTFPSLREKQKAWLMGHLGRDSDLSWLADGSNSVDGVSVD
jgi:hypothetical protein